MSLLEFQKTLLLLYTHEGERRAFRDDRDGVVANRGLTEREQRALKGLDIRDMEHFAQELIGKRLEVSRKLMKRSSSLAESPVFVFPSHRSGPALFFQTERREREVAISPDVLPLLFTLIDNQKTLSFGAIFNALRDTECSLRSFFELTRIIYANSLHGREVRQLLAY